VQHEIEQYRKYKDLKEKLRETFRQLHLDPQKPAMDENDAGSQPCSVAGTKDRSHD
jgi:hypothetical protein